MTLEKPLLIAEEQTDVRVLLIHAANWRSKMSATAETRSAVPELTEEPANPVEQLTYQ